ALDPPPAGRRRRTGLAPRRIAPVNEVSLRQQPTVSSVLAVPGMHCAGCISRIERGLAGRPGIVSSRVNLSARQVTIEHDRSLDARDLVAELERIGFEAEPRKGALAASPSQVRPLLAPLAVAAFAAMNVMLLSVSVR